VKWVVLFQSYLFVMPTVCFEFNKDISDNLSELLCGRVYNNKLSAIFNKI
jgi:hypothetical protein